MIRRIEREHPLGEARDDLAAPALGGGRPGPGGGGERGAAAGEEPATTERQRPHQTPQAGR